ncbi:hypothetical protein BGV40_11020 [Methanosarcina sp. Ant1]|nr:hypothetical protein BGV40_11020 [Methanosarcina sp. Ant1]
MSLVIAVIGRNGAVMAGDMLEISFLERIIQMSVSLKPIRGHIMTFTYYIYQKINSIKKAQLYKYF